MPVLADFVFINSNGLYCKYGDFYIDPKIPVSKAVISHAHADHAISGNNQIYCTEATLAFMHLRYGKNSAKIKNTFSFNNSFKIGEVTVTFIPSGHILGSAQILMEYNSVKYLYTGDYKLQADATCETIEWVNADVLITESTFANPNIKHPDHVEEIKKINNIKTNILLGAYSLGKSQRLIKLINDYAPQKTILVHFRIHPINLVYEKFGYSPGKSQLYSRKLMKNTGENVYIVPPFTFDSYLRADNVTRLFASGWETLQVNKTDTLFISDHVDWNDILQTITKVNPSQLWTMHGNGIELKKYFADKLLVKLLN